MYFLMIRPQKKRAEKTSGDVECNGGRRQLVTTSGFYGVVIDMTERGCDRGVRQ